MSEPGLTLVDPPHTGREKPRRVMSEWGTRGDIMASSGIGKNKKTTTAINTGYGVVIQTNLTRYVVKRDNVSQY